jgi:hypothetical protein
MSDASQPPGPYLRRLELAVDRIGDAVRRLKHRDRLWVLNRALAWGPECQAVYWVVFELELGRGRIQALA